jgi:hypothetical protein|tara:strand:+ start:699 stop:1106 length:408 start_codon:yes stop_codon:yes gene_type:complete
MSIGPISVNIVRNGPLGKIATFSWPPSSFSSWKVRINETQEYSVNTATFSMAVPNGIFGNCKTCVEVKGINADNTFTDYSNKLCINNIPDRYCGGQVSQHPSDKKAKISTFKGSSSKMRWARTIRMGGKFSPYLE